MQLNPLILLKNKIIKIHNCLYPIKSIMIKVTSTKEIIADAVWSVKTKKENRLTYLPRKK